jgi:hypothetical protein
MLARLNGRGTNPRAQRKELAVALHRICLIAGTVSTLMFMTPAVARDYGVQGHHGQGYGRVHAHRYYVFRRGGGLFGCRHWSPIGWYWTCYFW